MPTPCGQEMLAKRPARDPLGPRAPRASAKTGTPGQASQRRATKWTSRAARLHAPAIRHRDQRVSRAAKRPAGVVQGGDVRFGHFGHDRMVRCADEAAAGTQQFDLPAGVRRDLLGGLAAQDIWSCRLRRRTSADRQIPSFASPGPGREGAFARSARNRSRSRSDREAPPAGSRSSA